MNTTPTVSTRPLALGLIVALLLGGALTLVLLTDEGLAGLFPSGDQVEVTLDGYAIAPPRITVDAAEPVTLVLTNTSGFAHNLAVGRDPITEAGRIVGFDEDLLAASEVRTTPAHALVRPGDPARPLSVTVDPGATVEVELTVPDTLRGTWEFGCFKGSGCDAHVGVSATIVVE